MQENTEQDRKKDRKNEVVDIAMHQTGIRNTNAQPGNQFFITGKKEDSSRKPGNPNTENDKNLRRLLNSK